MKVYIVYGDCQYEGAYVPYAVFTTKKQAEKCIKLRASDIGGERQEIVALTLNKVPKAIVPPPYHYRCTLAIT
jgi:hypothetical protein